MKRIVIVGCAGSGKSTLAHRLGQHLGLPVVHLDVLFWRPGWKAGDTAEFRDRVAVAMAGDTWISEGNFVDETFDLRLPRADTIVILERSRWICLLRVIWRAIFHRQRPDLPAGCPESPDEELLSYIWNFGRITRPHMEAALLPYLRDKHVIRLRRGREIAALLAPSDSGRHHRPWRAPAGAARSGRQFPPNDTSAAARSSAKLPPRVWL